MEKTSVPSTWRGLRERFTRLALAPEPLFRAYLLTRTGSLGLRQRPQHHVLNRALLAPAEWQQALASVKRLRLQPHEDGPKNWDALGALDAILSELPISASVLAARVSSPRRSGPMSAAPPQEPSPAALDPARPVTPGQQLASAASTLFLTRSAGILLAWVLEIALVRTLEPAAWAVMSRFLTLTALFAVAQLGLPESVLYFAARTTAPRSALTLTARTSLLLGGLGAALTLPFHAAPALTSRLLGALGPSALSSLSAFVICDLAFAPLPSLLLAQRRQKLAGALSFGTRLLIALFVLAALLGGGGLEPALRAMALGAVSSLVIGWFVVSSVVRQLFHGENTWERAHFLRRLHTTRLDQLRHFVATRLRRNIFSHPAFQLTEAERASVERFLSESRALELLQPAQRLQPGQSRPSNDPLK